MIRPDFKFLNMLKRLSAALIFLCIAGILGYQNAAAQTVNGSPTAFRIGEKLTYSVSFERFTNVAYAELHTVSRGRLGDKDVVELRSRIKTLDFVSAAFYLIDESRTSFAAPDSGLPLFTSKSEKSGGLPRETIHNYLTAPTVNFDLLTLIYKIRHLGGNGALTVQENEKTYNVTFQSAAGERVKTEAGEFETLLTSVQSEYLAEVGIKELRINLTADDAKIPALIRIKTAKGEFRAVIAGIGNTEPVVVIQPLPTPMSTPLPQATPKPLSTPRPYIENQPLSPELSFQLGESLDYRISANSQPVATIRLEARERKQFLGADSLLLTATINTVEPGNPFFNLNDSIRAQVNPETLGPQQIDIRFTGAFSSFNQSAQFDPATSLITFNGTNKLEAPVGTHNILSFIYAIRSFNLKPSKDASNPINDTRVAVFWQSRTYVFTLRPSAADLITFNGEKVSAQLISISTGTPELDQLNLRIWLSNDERRVPLRFAAGLYQADLITDANSQPK